MEISLHRDARKPSCVRVRLVGFEQRGSGVVDYGKWLKIGSAIRIDRKRREGKGRFLPCDSPIFLDTA